MEDSGDKDLNPFFTLHFAALSRPPKHCHDHELLKSAMLQSSEMLKSEIYPRKDLHLHLKLFLSTTELKNCFSIFPTNVSLAFCKRFIGGQKIPTTILLGLRSSSEFDTIELVAWRMCGVWTQCGI